MLGFTLGLKGIAIASVIAAVTGFGSGWLVKDAFCDAAAEKVRADAAEARERGLRATIKQQQDQITTLNTLRLLDAKRAVDDAKAERGNQENINATPPNTNRCFDAAAARRVRNTR
jgi:hypothetical protein